MLFCVRNLIDLIQQFLKTKMKISKMKTMKISVGAILMSGLMITAVHCKKDDNKVSSPTPTQKEITLQTSATLGKYLVDKQNRTLYYFSNDPSGQDSCTGGCQAFWPIFNVDNLTADKLGDGLSISDFGSVTSVSGKKASDLQRMAPVLLCATCKRGKQSGSTGANNG
jgi:predicted lipoprotein with Yx(FWY)xxD motif